MRSFPRKFSIVTASVSDGSSRQLPASPRSDSAASDATRTEHATAAQPVPQGAARACLHDEVVPALTAAMLRIHLLVETSEESRPLGNTALAELERAAAGIQQVMAELNTSR